MTSRASDPAAASLPRVDAIVVAAGESRRMGGADKLAVEVAGRPLLAWSIDAVAAAPEVDRIVVVVGAGRAAAVGASGWLSPKVAAVVEGGGRRQESVAAGLAELDRLDATAAGATSADGADRIVLVHDGARPLASAALVSAVALAAARDGAAIPVVPVAETLKRVDGGLIEATVDRAPLAAAQTPQGMRRELLRAAHERFPANGPDTWTDEASLLEACRIPVHAIPGEPGNLKVTLPSDLATVELALAATPASAVRIGFGQDSHPFGPAAGLMLGGVVIDGAPRLFGHSDGDVALHAVADALLGAAGLGDLGRLFPANDTTPRGIASRDLLAEVVRRVEAVGLRPVSVDLTIVAARPSLGGHLDAMRLAVGELTGAGASAVNVKASTGNLAGMEGAGRGISAQAVAVLARGR